MTGPRRYALALLPAAALLSGCDETQNALAPESHQAKDIASLFWWMMGGAWIGLALVVALLLLAWRRSNRRGIGSDADTTDRKPGEKTAWYVVVGLGIVMPVALIAALFVISDLFVIKTTQAPAAASTQLTVRVIGHMWWWEVRYPGTTAVTANEIHIPVRTPVRVEVQTKDVIHSFWVPRLARTIDTIPGRTNAIELYADAAGRYRGQCDEFCGLQHAHMAFYVYADPPAVYRRWLARESKPVATKPPKLFDTAGCASCHAMRGTDANADVGPDLTHVGSRTTLAALAIPNDRAHLEDWILHNQEIKPGNQMPDVSISRAQASALAAYLEGLK
jgi:cytochrome c oxidase subunit II